ncbi:MAG: 50S ribosomal protein L21 [Chloracidobacterium sp.]|uniref:Large ribosomal subunit protein bL21 n=1 Tax=Chloracidobacterium validum TaxID=2821543 RepID=A0ABX8B7S7_9BACT|nr:50S ribosomal protein L21 [Chloracidobacterium validum]QUW03012.1 50S ribosomal protein L21 [Chloracidobacterium validum]
MPYAIVTTGGKQFRVAEGDVVQVPSLEAEPGKTVSLEVLAMHTGSEFKVGAPRLTGASVTASVIGHGRAKKIIVFKFKRRKQYRRKRGHRQNFTALHIQKIELAA